MAGSAGRRSALSSANTTARRITGSGAEPSPARRDAGAPLLRSAALIPASTATHAHSRAPTSSSSRRTHKPCSKCFAAAAAMLCGAPGVPGAGHPAYGPTGGCRCAGCAGCGPQSERPAGERCCAHALAAEACDGRLCAAWAASQRDVEPGGLHASAQPKQGHTWCCRKSPQVAVLLLRGAAGPTIMDLAARSALVQRDDVEAQDAWSASSDREPARPRRVHRGCCARAPLRPELRWAQLRRLQPEPHASGRHALGAQQLWASGCSSIRLRRCHPGQQARARGCVWKRPASRSFALHARRCWTCAHPCCPTIGTSRSSWSS